MHSDCLESEPILFRSAGITHTRWTPLQLSFVPTVHIFNFPFQACIQTTATATASERGQVDGVGTTTASISSNMRHYVWEFLANLLPRLLVAFQDMSADTGNVYSLCCCNLTVALFLHFMFYHSCFLPTYISISPTTAHPGWVIHLSKHQLEIKKYILYLMCVILPTIQYV